MLNVRSRNGLLIAKTGYPAEVYAQMRDHAIWLDSQGVVGRVEPEVLEGLESRRAVGSE